MDSQFRVTVGIGCADSVAPEGRSREWANPAAKPTGMRSRRLERASARSIDAQGRQPLGVAGAFANIPLYRLSPPSSTSVSPVM